MTTTKIIAALAFLLAATGAAFAQSAYTSGTEASSVAAGYPSPYGGGAGVYAYVPNYGHRLGSHSRRRRR